MATESLVFKKKSHLYIPFFSFVLKPWATWSALGAKQCFFLSHVYKNVFKRVAWPLNHLFLKKSHLYIPFFSFVLKPWATWSALGAKQGLTIVHFLNKLIVSCKEAVRFPFYFFLGGGVIFVVYPYPSACILLFPHVAIFHHINIWNSYYIFNPILYFFYYPF